MGTLCNLTTGQNVLVREVFIIDRFYCVHKVDSSIFLSSVILNDKPTRLKHCLPPHSMGNLQSIAELYIVMCLCKALTERERERERGASRKHLFRLWLQRLTILFASLLLEITWPIYGLTDSIYYLHTECINTMNYIINHSSRILLH